MAFANNATLGHIIVFGNEKGGCGKSTAAMHVTVALMRLGYSVGTIDLDARQGTFTRYLGNRFQTIMRDKLDQPMPNHMPIMRSGAATLKEKQAEESHFLYMALEEQAKANDFVVIDTPGADAHLTRLAHRFADTLVTPVNDSMIDLDLLADIDPETLQCRGPSTYTKAVTAVREARKKEFSTALRWIVMRNRINPSNLKSKREIETLLPNMAKRFGFKYIPGFSERIIFRDMFLKGLTLLDLEGADSGKGMTASELAARQEVRLLVHAVVPEDMRLSLMRRKKAQQISA